MAFGAENPRNRFRALLSPLRRLMVCVYHDPVKDSFKIEEVELLAAHEGLAKEPQRFFSAARWAELIRSAPSLEPGAFDLLSEALRLAEQVSPEGLLRLETQFLWRLTEEAGLKPDFLYCESCGTPLFGSSVSFSTNPLAVFCSQCLVGHWTLTPKEVDYLTATSVHSLEDSLLAPTETSALEHLRAIAFELWSQILGRKIPRYG